MLLSQMLTSSRLSFGLQDRPVIIARTQFIREHRLYEVVSVWSTYLHLVRLMVQELHPAWCLQGIQCIAASKRCTFSNSCHAKGFNILDCCQQLLHI